jgi:hypothetical protein
MKYLASAVVLLALAVLTLWRVMAAHDDRAAAEIAALKQMAEKLSSKPFSGGNAVIRPVTEFPSAVAALPFGPTEQHPQPAQPAPPAAPSASSAGFADIQAYYQASMEAQNTDGNWSRDATRNLRGIFDELIDTAKTAATTLKSVECRQSICRAELGHDSVGDARVFMRAWMYGQARQKWKGGFSGGVDPSKSDGAVRSVFFLAREGTELPAYN